MKPKAYSRDWKLRLQDIIEAIEKIQRYTDKMTMADFKQNQMIIDAVSRNFEIIGEASNYVPVAVKKSCDEVSWKQTIALCNNLMHDCFNINIDAIWQAIQTDLPLLKTVLKEIKI